MLSFHLLYYCGILEIGFKVEFWNSLGFSHNAEAMQLQRKGLRFMGFVRAKIFF